MSQIAPVKSIDLTFECVAHSRVKGSFKIEYISNQQPVVVYRFSPGTDFSLFSLAVTVDCVCVSFNRRPGLEFVGDMTAHMDNYRPGSSPSLVDSGSVESGALSEDTLVSFETRTKEVELKTPPLGTSIEIGLLESAREEMLGHVYAVKTTEGYDMVVHYTGPAGGLVKVEFYVRPKETMVDNDDTAMRADLADQIKGFKQVVMGLPKFTETTNVLFKGPMASGQESIVVETVPLAASCKNVEEMSWSWITFVPNDFAASANNDLVIKFNKSPLVEVQPYIDNVQMSTLVEEIESDLVMTHDMLIWFHLKDFDYEVPVWSTFNISKTFVFMLAGMVVTHNNKPIKFKVVCGRDSISLSCSYIDAPKNQLCIKFKTLVPRQTMVYSLPCINMGPNQTWERHGTVTSRIEQPLVLIDNGQEQESLEYMSNSNTTLAIHFKDNLQSVHLVIQKAHYAVHVDDSDASRKKVDLTVRFEIEVGSQTQGVPLAVIALAGWAMPEYCYVNREPAKYMKTDRGLAVLAKTSGPINTVELFWRKTVSANVGNGLFYIGSESYYEGELPYLEHKVTKVTSKVDSLKDRFSTIEQLDSGCVSGGGRKVKAILGIPQRQTKRQLLFALIVGVCYILVMTYILPSLPERSQPAPPQPSNLPTIPGLGIAQQIILAVVNVAAFPVRNVWARATSQAYENLGVLATATVTETETAINFVTVLTSTTTTETTFSSITETVTSTITAAPDKECSQGDNVAAAAAAAAADLEQELEACKTQLTVHARHFKTLQSQFISLDRECFGKLG